VISVYASIALSSSAVVGLSPYARARELLAAAAWKAHPGHPGSLLAELRESQWWSPDQLADSQAELLREVVAAAARVPFYRSRLAAAGIVPERLRGPDELRVLPPLSREELQAQGPARLRVPGRRGLRASSSGSTGRPVATIWPVEMMAWFEAADRRSDEWLGVRLGERRLNVAASPSVRVARRRAAAGIANVTRLFAVDVTEPVRARRLARELRRRPPALVWGISNSLYVLGLALTEAGLSIPARACVSEGNHLHQHYRATIEAAFGCRVLERYGSWETGILAHECPEGGSLHVLAEGAIVEVVRPDGSPAGAGEVGDVLVTLLHNRAMPLLRYRIGDLVEVPAESGCACGRGLPLLGRLVGRANELLLAAGGRLIPPEAVSAIMTSAAASVVEFQVVQQANLRLDVALVQRGEAREAFAEGIRAALDELVGLPGATRVEPVAAIPLTASGKLRHVVSHARPTVTSSAGR
jgi:phenylacetate-CoA ligase